MLLKTLKILWWACDTYYYKESFCPSKYSLNFWVWIS